MARNIKRMSKSAGFAPGTLIHIGESKTDKVKISVIDYDEANFQEKQVGKVEDCFQFRDTPTVTWVNVDGIHDTDIIEKIGAHFQLHPLILEDIVNTAQRPKYEDYDNYLFIVIKMLYPSDEEGGMHTEQVSLILGKNYLISFQEEEGDIFGVIRERIRQAKGRIRKMGADYLAYSLIDAVVDNYFSIIERMGERVEAMEDELVSNPGPRTVQVIHSLKRDAIFLRKSVWPLREVANSLEKGESSLIKKPTRVFLRDVYDHTIQVIDTIETFRDMISGMLDIYLSSMSNRMNEIMKVLTIFAAIFIPLTFIAGIYGMNFQYMPELGWRWGYFGVLGIMTVVIMGMLTYFKRKNWL